MRRREKLHVLVFGAGKVGRGLAGALRSVRSPVTLVPARNGWPRRPISADIIVLALRDRELMATVELLRSLKGVWLPTLKKAVVVHVAGALTADVLAPLRAVTAGVAQMHPMISFASPSFTPSLERGNMHVDGDVKAVAKAKKLALAIGMKPRHFKHLDAVGYHAAAALLANGAAALAFQAAEVLAASNVPRLVAPKLLGPLLRSVADNVERLGFPAALTGPVRRGDVHAIDRGAQMLAARTPAVLPLYRATVAAQLPLARALREISPESLDAIERWLTLH